MIAIMQYKLNVENLGEEDPLPNSYLFSFNYSSVSVSSVAELPP